MIFKEILKLASLVGESLDALVVMLTRELYDKKEIEDVVGVVKYNRSSKRMRDYGIFNDKNELNHKVLPRHILKGLSREYTPHIKEIVEKYVAPHIGKFKYNTKTVEKIDICVGKVLDTRIIIINDKWRIDKGNGRLVVVSEPPPIDFSVGTSPKIKKAKKKGVGNLYGPVKEARGLMYDETPVKDWKTKEFTRYILDKLSGVDHLIAPVELRRIGPFIREVGNEKYKIFIDWLMNDSGYTNLGIQNFKSKKVYAKHLTSLTKKERYGTIDIDKSVDYEKETTGEVF